MLGLRPIVFASALYLSSFEFSNFSLCNVIISDKQPFLNVRIVTGRNPRWRSARKHRVIYMNILFRYFVLTGLGLYEQLVTFSGHIGVAIMWLGGRNLMAEFLIWYELCSQVESGVLIEIRRHSCPSWSLIFASQYLFCDIDQITNRDRFYHSSQTIDSFACDRTVANLNTSRRNDVIRWYWSVGM